MKDIQKMMAYLGTAGFAIPGIIIFLITVGDMVNKQKLLEDVLTTTGKVIATGTRVVETGSGKNRSRGIVSYAEIDYTADKGESYVFEHTYGMLEGSFQKGDEVPVLYLPDAHDEAMVNTFGALWLSDVAILLASFMFMGGGFLVYKFVMPKERAEGDFRPMDDL